MNQLTQAEARAVADELYERARKGGYAANSSCAGIEFGDSVTVTVGDTVATGTAIGGVANGGNFMVKLDGTGEIIGVPDRLVARL